MKVKIIKHNTVEEEIDVNLPYYYKHDMSDDDENIIYGMIDGKFETTIHEVTNYINNTHSFKIELDIWGKCGSYFADEHKSSEEEFLKAKNNLSKFLKDTLY